MISDYFTTGGINPVKLLRSIIFFIGVPIAAWRDDDTIYFLTSMNLEVMALITLSVSTFKSNIGTNFAVLG